MTRKAFIADVASAAAGSISGVSQVVRGAEDGELDFCFTSAYGQLINVHILALGRQAFGYSPIKLSKEFLFADHNKTCRHTQLRIHS
jgi:hypothetical protein